MRLQYRCSREFCHERGSAVRLPTAATGKTAYTLCVMAKSGRIPGIVCAWALLASVSALPGDTISPQRLQQTRAVNIGEIIDRQFGPAKAESGFRVVDPYGDATSQTVQDWARHADGEQTVCALRFLDAVQQDYELRDFASPQAAAAAGFIVTHYGRCGSCSTLRDLAVYLTMTDLTTPARQCARKFGLQRRKQCFQKSLGFSSYCAESWAYNARHTRQACLGSCVADYGFFNLLFNRYPGPNVDESGRLRPCLQCDEEQSGPGFRYSAGRTRRNSGIESEIPRPDKQVRMVDHSRYFR